MRTILVTPERVQAAINELTMQGARVSVRNVQAKLGGGNNTSIGRHLKALQSRAEEENSELVTLRRQVQELESLLATLNKVRELEQTLATLRSSQTDSTATGCRVWVDNNVISVAIKEQTLFDQIPGHVDASAPMQQKLFVDGTNGKQVMVKFIGGTKRGFK